ncbi:MAG: pyridoxine 5'-phosphate synthase [Muribaculaceae bacterium]|nr:pyridoxine 5'-phosphate synthase [Muribaculaceae bacterium]
MTRLSVNINKVATIRNARGENNPDLVRFALACEAAGADGITIHPRPDERHIRRSDVPLLKQAVSTELNMEGYPSEDFIRLVIETQPAQVTLVPDAPGQLTSNHGWNVTENFDMLSAIIRRFKEAGIRVSVFVDPDSVQVLEAKLAGADRVELYTKEYADNYAQNRELAIAPFVEAASAARVCGLGLNAGHDLSLENLRYFHEMIPWVDEVSIGHALICDALYLGLDATVKAYLACLLPSMHNA